LQNRLEISNAAKKYGQYFSLMCIIVGVCEKAKTWKGISVTPTFAVNEAKNRWLLEKMEALAIREEDIEEKFLRSSGKGGQHVNKTSTCVYLKHLPTGMEVKCMKERSQSVNRFLARRELVEKIEALSGAVTARQSKQDKLRKQKTKRKKRAAAKYESTESEIHDKK
jgi:protein subunit release factor B